MTIPIRLDKILKIRYYPHTIVVNSEAATIFDVPRIKTSKRKLCYLRTMREFDVKLG